jgi:hypothetical protein
MSRREAPLSTTAEHLFAGAGPSRAALRAVAWDVTPLGEVEIWPVDLYCAAHTVLAAPAPMVLWWGEQFHQIHNDAMTAALGDDEPAVGRPAKECWPDRWEVLGPAVALALAEGEAAHIDGITLPGATGSATHWTVSLAPLRDEADRPAGVLASAVDVSTRVAVHELERCAAEDTVANLQLALATNRRIGTAIGILMAHRRITDEAAFDLLRDASQRTHRKLREIADEVVLTGTVPGAI